MNEAKVVKREFAFHPIECLSCKRKGQQPQLILCRLQRVPRDHDGEEIGMVMFNSDLALTRATSVTLTYLLTF